MNDTKNQIVKIGDRFWRGVDVNFPRPNQASGVIRKTVDVFEEAQKTDKGSFMVRAVPGTCWCVKEPGTFVASPKKATVGMVCLIKEQLPENWTYIKVTGLSKNGNACFGVAVCGDMEELKNQYGLPDQTPDKPSIPVFKGKRPDICPDCKKPHNPVNEGYCDCGACLYEHSKQVHEEPGSEFEGQFPIFQCLKCGRNVFWD